METKSLITVNSDDTTSSRRSDGSSEIKSVFKTAYAAELPAMMAIPEGEVLQIKLDIDDMITSGLGVWAKIQPYREEAAKLPGFEIGNFDRLESRFLALREAETQYDNACECPDELEPLSQRAFVLRDLLSAEVEVAILHGLINREAVKDVSGVRGYKIVASDLLTLAGALAGALPRMQGRSFVSCAQLEEAEQLAAKILNAVGRREQAPVVIAATADIRARAYTLAMNTYDQVNRAITYLRWGKDAGELTPSLFSGRVKRRAPELEKPSVPMSPATPATPVAPGSPANPVPVRPDPGVNPGGYPFIS